MADKPHNFVGRGGMKLDHALAVFNLDVTGLVCADLGCHAGGFTDCLLQRGAAKVYAVDTGYGVLDYKLRKDARVVVMERANAMHVSLPEAVDLVVIDVGWTRQKHILPAAKRLLKPGGRVVSLIKPHYEATPDMLVNKLLPEAQLEPVLERVRSDISAAGFTIRNWTDSPILGNRGNREMLGELAMSD
ncbi:MAG: TlyA family RNA methyltransferase [Phycisphaerae bacterium]